MVGTSPQDWDQVLLWSAFATEREIGRGEDAEDGRGGGGGGNASARLPPSPPPGEAAESAAKKAETARAAAEAAEAEAASVRAAEEMKNFLITKKDLRSIFDALDVNHDGRITHAEFIKGLRKYPEIGRKVGLHSQGLHHQEGADRDEYVRKFTSMDVDGSHSIDFDEMLKYYTPWLAGASGRECENPVSEKRFTPKPPSSAYSSSSKMAHADYASLGGRVGGNGDRERGAREREGGPRSSRLHPIAVAEVSAAEEQRRGASSGRGKGRVERGRDLGALGQMLSDDVHYLQRLVRGEM